MDKTKIDWCDERWNPVWGCLNHCEYCYARKMAMRFGDKDFLPRWIEKNFVKPCSKKPSRIFVNSMSDICWWEKEWMHKVLDKIENHPEHIFQFLTKKPYIYERYTFPSNCWLGTTITNQSMMNNFADLIFESPWVETNKIFFSIEPILERIQYYVNPDWVIVGAETGNRKGKVVPRREWITELVDYCKTNQIPVFLKESLREIWGSELIQEFPG